MHTTARQALNALIDDLVGGPVVVPQPRPEPVQQPAVPSQPTAAALRPTAPRAVAELTVQPAVAPAYDALPAGARSAILWRSRTA